MKDLIEYLQTLPEDATIEVISAVVYDYGFSVSEVDFDQGKVSFHSYDEHAKILTLGDYDR